MRSGRLRAAAVDGYAFDSPLPDGAGGSVGAGQRAGEMPYRGSRAPCQRPCNFSLDSVLQVDQRGELPAGVEDIRSPTPAVHLGSSPALRRLLLEGLQLAPGEV